MTERIASYARTKALVEKHEFRFKKNLGQNFLIDAHVLQKIVASAELTKDDYVIEIGPGMGSLTQELAKSSGAVTAIEIDKKLIPILSESLEPWDNVTILNEDILKVDIQKLVTERGYKSAKVVANLPYYITTPIIMDLLEKKHPVSSIIVMVQKEVAERIKAKPATKDYGALSLAVQYRAEPYIVANVPPNCFLPRPNVDSAVICLTPFSTQPVPVKDENLFFTIIKSAFSQRRKTLVNCLSSSTELSLSKEEATKLIIASGLNEKVRGETLGLNEFCCLANNLQDFMLKNK